MRFATLNFILLLLFLLDAWTTAFLVENFDGQEMNPYLDTTNFFTILFSPSHFFVAGIVFVCLIYAEVNEHHFQSYYKQASLKLCPFFFPFYFMMTKTLAVVNNTFPMVGLSTPIHWLIMPFEFFSSDKSNQAFMLYFLLTFLLAPAFIPISKKLYGRKYSQDDYVSVR